MAASPSGADSLQGLNLPVFEIKDIPGKGRGLIARVNIPSGTRILCEKPLFTAQPTIPSVMEPILATKLKALPKASQRQFLSLHNNFPGKYPFSHTFGTNALSCGPDSAVGGVYPTICLINHSCMPNCHNNWNDDLKHETIHAVTPIKVGEEITIPYVLPDIGPRRRANLQQKFGFRCNCTLCSRPYDELMESDTRLLVIQRLDDAIGNPSQKPEDSLKDCHSLVQLLTEEYEGYAAVLHARAYFDAFQICIANGDQARASVFADKAYKARVICEGDDSPETRNMRSLARDPTQHYASGLSGRKWRTTKGMVPKGLDTEQFEKWLFRE